MNFQEKLFETSAELRSRMQAIANTALERARLRAEATARRAEKLKGSIAILNTAGRELNKVARRHAVRFVEQNSMLASQVRDDVSKLARSTITTLTRLPAKKPRKTTVARKRARKAARRAH
jgi:hypothetical protein